MYIVLWLRTSGLEVQEAFVFDDAGEAFEKFTELDKKNIQSFPGLLSRGSLEKGNKLISASGTEEIIHAFRI